jgi:hypothetical protein
MYLAQKSVVNGQKPVDIGLLGQGQMQSIQFTVAYRLQVRCPLCREWASEPYLLCKPQESKRDLTIQHVRISRQFHLQRGTSDPNQISIANEFQYRFDSFGFLPNACVDRLIRQSIQSAGVKVNSHRVGASADHTVFSLFAARKLSRSRLIP